MKRYIVLLAVMALSVPACFDNDPSGPSKKNDDEKSPYSGRFLISDTLESTSCVIPAPPENDITITIEGDKIFFDTFSGQWDSLTVSGGGTSPEFTVPVDPPTCYSYCTVTFSITYTDTDHFHGTYSAAIRKDPTCPNPAPCSFTYRIGGTRID